MKFLEDLRSPHSEQQQQQQQLAPQSVHSTTTTTSCNNDPNNVATIGIGLDSCVIPLRHAGLNLIQTTDFFYPLIEDPYLMGKIACANVLSDLYAMGVQH